jgi:hypothetical protein
MGRTIRHCSLILVLAACLDVGRPALAMGVSAPEYAIKAVFLYNFVKYAEWPASPEPLSPIVIAVIGEDPFGSALDDAVRDRVVRSRPLVVVRYSSLRNVKPCHVAFVSASEAGHAKEAVQALARYSALVVGDTQELAQAGAVINFVTDGGKVRFDVNQAAARHSGIVVSSQLLKLARRVVEPGA